MVSNSRAFAPELQCHRRVRKDEKPKPFIVVAAFSRLSSVEGAHAIQPDKVSATPSAK
jgi:hypothetical protein